MIWKRSVVAQIYLMTVALTVISLPGHVSANGTELSDSVIDAKLKELNTLPKPHFYWPPSPDISEKRLNELARITHSICVFGNYVKQEQIEKYVQMCGLINRNKPAIETTLGINFTPLANLDKKHSPSYRGPDYVKEVKSYQKRLQIVKYYIEQSNINYKTPVKVGAITLDIERYSAKPDNKTWNKFMCNALDTIHSAAANIFPEARIEWYGRGVKHDASVTGWSNSPYFTGQEIKPSLSCAIYSVPELELMRETFRRTARLADQMGVADVTPWIALASGYRRGKETFSYWDFDWSYDIVYSYLLGRELNINWFGDRPERFAPYHRAKVIIFYPPPFDVRVPDWPRHFIAYVRGATAIKQLDDLGYLGD